ncbi:ATP-binding protein [Pelosinus sp. sgz500959]|uniref:ATP-binding protein n=1 Tax=Pelosinus sp. sgz500959 TaxID=3242472 RepID=UPI00367039DD
MAYFKGISNHRLGYMERIFSENKSLINTVLLVSLTSIVYVYPFGSYFRFTLAIVLLTIFLLYFERLPILTGTIITGVFILIFRTLTDFIIDGHDYVATVMSNVPSLAYYISFGILFSLLSIRKNTNNILALILLLSVTDIISNIIELFCRSELLSAKFAFIFPSIVAVAIVRAILSVIGYYALKQHQSFILANDHAERYIEQTVMVAKLKCELFYLEKSSQDIENVMEKAYWLYKQLNSQERSVPAESPLPADEALAIAREIHEIKKDYSRVVAGMENILRPSSRPQETKLSEILFIIEQNTMRYLSVMDKKISISYKQADDFVTDKHYTLVSILDNLIMNSIEAIGDHGIIRLIQTSSSEEVFFCVEDNGIGIDENEFELIFNPGYSTKFSPRTGKISTGLGLAHVRIYIELLGGTIRVESLPGVCTKFFITFPKSGIILAPVNMNALSENIDN